MLKVCDFDDLPIGGGKNQSWFLRNVSPWVAEERNDEHKKRARNNRGVPPFERQRDCDRQERPAHQLDFGQAPARQRQLPAPVKWVVFTPPVAIGLVAAEFQIAGVKDLVRGPNRFANSL